MHVLWNDFSSTSLTLEWFVKVEKVFQCIQLLKRAPLKAFSSSDIIRLSLFY